MKTILLTACAVLGVLPRPAAAHRLDEYLQATRVAVATDRVDVEMDLTPGVSIARSIFARIDRDVDGRIAEAEIEAYGRSVLDDVSLRIDGRAYRLTLDRAEGPAWPEMRDGLGTISIRASVAVPLGTSGDHRLRLDNFHQPEVSVYLANALVPSTRAVSIVAQHRDPRQRRFDLDIRVTSTRSVYGWLALQGLVFAALLAYRAR